MIRTREEWNGIRPGVKIHNLTVLGQQFRRYSGKPNTKPAWQCVVRCECGTVKIVMAGDLARGMQKSCGCHRVKVAIRMGKRNVRHGETGTKLHNIWHLMKLRCSDPNQDSYPRYGGRGIQVCQGWQDSYEAFRDHAMASGYKPGLQIDRIDNDGHYEPGNIRFVTCKENNRNRCNTQMINAFGETKPLAAWAEDPRCQVSYYTLWRRLSGKSAATWNAESAIQTPSLPRGMRASVPSSMLERA